MPAAEAELGINPTQVTDSKAVELLTLFRSVDNEYKKADIPILKPLLFVYPDNHQLEEQTNEALPKDFEYLSRTRDLEVDTDRTRLIQTEIVDKMTAGEDIPTQVVIMRKGRSPQAFVTPDGTIWITQSLLNKMANLDELAGVLGHEIGHLVDKTSVRVSESAGSAGGIGTGWIHESDCDLRLAPQMMERAGFNTWEYANMIEKIGGYERDFEHQTGQARGSQSIGGHSAIDRETSSQAVVPFPRELRGSFRKTNFEIAMDHIQSHNYEDFARAIDKLDNYPTGHLHLLLEKLHPKDLGRFYKHLVHSRDHTGIYPVLKIANQLIMSRLDESGFSKAEAKLFIASYLETDYISSKRDGYLIETLDEFREIAAAVPEFEAKDKYNEIHQQLFSSPNSTATRLSRLFINFLSKRLYDENYEQIDNGVPVTHDDFLDALEIISEHQDRGHWQDSRDRQAISETLFNYISMTFPKIVESSGQLIDKEQIINFFTEIKDRNINLDAKYLMELFETDKHRTPFHYFVENARNFIFSPNGKILVEAAKEVFEIEEIGELTFEEIDRFFESFADKEAKSRQKDLLSGFLNSTKEKMQKQELTDQQRLVFVQYIFSKIEDHPLEFDYSLLKQLSWKTEIYGQPEGDVSLNDQISKFSLSLLFATSLFEKDGQEFYGLVEGLMTKYNGDFKGLSYLELVNLCMPIFVSDKHTYANFIFISEGLNYVSGSDFINLENYERLLNLPFMKMIMEKQQGLTYEDLSDLSGHIEYEKQVLHTEPYRTSNLSFFNDDLLSLMLGGKSREHFIRFLDAGIKEEEYGTLHNFINLNFPEGVQRDQYLREINKLYLKSSNVTFEEKVDYLIQYFDKVGDEGALMLAEQITDMPTYEFFREKMVGRLGHLLEGEVVVSKAAAGDYLTSFLARGFKNLFETCKTDLKSKKETSTRFAKNWFFLTFIERTSSSPPILYDHTLKRFFLSPAGRSVFRTVGDSFRQLKNLPDIQKFALVHKALTDPDGAMSSRENRKEMAKILVSSMDLQKGFVGSVLSAACTEADAKLIGFPASFMIMPLLFRSMDLQSIDTKELKEGYVLGSSIGEEFSNDEIDSILSADSRSISEFGARFRNQPQSFVSGLARESDQQYLTTNGYLDRWFGINKTDDGDSKSEISENLEAVIGAVEKSGAMGIRALQLATQFHRFSPAMEKRLSESFDSNPGLEKLRFWENLLKISESDPALADLVWDLTLNDKIGAGSLQTTYSGELMQGSEQVPVVIKLRSPNLDRFITETYNSAQKALSRVARFSIGNNRRFANMGMVLMDLAKKWCHDDINDKTFTEDDDKFREVIESFNQTEGENFYAPERIFTSPKVKIERRAEGLTVNKVLQDPDISTQTKQDLVKRLGKFFNFQMTKTLPGEDDKPVHYIHSDPHVGNYIVDLSEGTPRIAVIDRSMYLKLAEADVAVLDRMKTGGNDNAFIYGFIDRVLTRDKVRGPQRGVITGKVMSELSVEYAKQRVSGQIDRFALMQVMLTSLQNGLGLVRKVDVPLDLRLMIRNITAIKELSQRYDIET